MFVKIRRRATQVTPRDENLKEVLAFVRKSRQERVPMDMLSEAVSKEFKSPYVIDGDWGEVLIQCDKVMMKNLVPKEKNGIRCLYLTVQKDIHEEHHEIEMLDSEVYFMNDDGKTIDRYCW